MQLYTKDGTMEHHTDVYNTFHLSIPPLEASCKD